MITHSILMRKSLAHLRLTYLLILMLLSMLMPTLPGIILLLLIVPLQKRAEISLFQLENAAGFILLMVLSVLGVSFAMRLQKRSSISCEICFAKSSPAKRVYHPILDRLLS